MFASVAKLLVMTSHLFEASSAGSSIFKVETVSGFFSIWSVVSQGDVTGAQCRAQMTRLFPVKLRQLRKYTLPAAALFHEKIGGAFLGRKSLSGKFPLR